MKMQIEINEAADHADAVFALRLLLTALADEPEIDGFILTVNARSEGDGVITFYTYDGSGGYTEEFFLKADGSYADQDGQVFA